MKYKTLILLIFSILLVSACGGSSQEPPVVESEPVQEEEIVEAVEEVEEAIEEEAEEGVEEPTEEVIEEESEVAAEEPTEEAVEEDTAVGFGDIPLSGTDPETGLEINPAIYGPGDTFIIRGIIISMNLTPVVSPEFLVESPEGVRYRFQSQPLADTYFTDGSQWLPHEFRQGVGAMATIVFDASLTTADIPSSDNLMLIIQE